MLCYRKISLTIIIGPDLKQVCNFGDRTFCSQEQNLFSTIRSLDVSFCGRFVPLASTLVENYFTNNVHDIHCYCSLTSASDLIYGVRSIPLNCSLFSKNAAKVINIRLQARRTNNLDEGWHHLLNSRAHRSNLEVYHLAPMLHMEASFVELQVTLLSGGHLWRQATLLCRSTGPPRCLLD